MFNFVKNKIAKRSKTRGGITFSDKELFEVSAKFKYVVDSKNNKVILLQTEKANGEPLDWKSKAKKLKLDLENSLIRSGTVSRKGKNQIPLVDIRNQIANGVFGDADYLQVNIYEDTVIVEGFETQNDKLPEEKSSGKAKKQNRIRSNGRTKKASVFDISQFAKTKKKFEVSFSKEELRQVAGQSHSFHIESILSYSEGVFEEIKESLENVHIPLQVASFFSGAGLMDQGFREAGFDIVFALEKDEQAAETYRHNNGDCIVVDDIQRFDFSLMKDAPVIVGGPPCQGFSAANRKTNFLDNPNNALVKRYVQAIKESSKCKVFVLENVPQILTAGEGKFKDEIIQTLSDFDITYGVLNSADYGCPQERSRAIFIGSKIGRIELPKPIYQPHEYVTVGQAFMGLHENIPNQTDYSKPNPDTEKRMRYIGQGENWKSIPDNLKTPKMLKGNTHSSIYRRLEEDKPSITITNVRKSNILHPTENRVLSIRECARLFGLRDSFEFVGNLSSKQQQIANGVPVQLAKAVGNVIKKAISMFNVRNKTESFVLV
ncbi:DNA cytosine methyltransferase [Heyndrickxia sporothermodurans]|uniref:DNA (cytosine-5-)-methyltransferase n=1 Tax=Siminovitchia thermophila TaxID=1245522 RepID=A0ABS2R9R0_9BACI|nr:MULTISPECIES: DNA cytosine methyltransferase [Bacillaceae]MBM7715336.1 DNA (cytosine-5)-methyltransferase 1 [Siminovitchia thermophila]MEB6549707.1 DNA cytosine methyltransferase [Heyndrickxia sporothermodurans]